MQTNLSRFAVGCLALVLAGSALADVKWRSTYQTAVAEAKASNKLVMVEFYTAWDPWGKRLEASTLADASVSPVLGKVVSVKVNVEKEGKELAQKFHVVNYPTVIFVDKNGNDVGTMDGFETPEEFVKHANTFIHESKEEASLRAKYSANPKNLDVITALGITEGDRYHISAALNKLHEAEALDPQNKTGKLSDLYNSVADYYQNASQYDSAVKYFKKTADTSKVTDKKAYALLSIATCYMSIGQPMDPTDPPTIDRATLIKNYTKALPYVKQTLTLPGLKDEDKQIAQRDLNTIQQVISGGGGEDDGGGGQ